MRTTRNLLRFKVAVAAAAGACAVAGCSLGSPGVAAEVGDRDISIALLSAAMDGIRAGNPESGQSPNLQEITLTLLILEPFVEQVAQKANVGVSADDAKAQLAKDATPDPAAVRVLRTYLTIQQLGAKGQDPIAEVQRALVAAKPRVNPRFGKFDVAALSTVKAEPNWLRPKPSASPEPVPGQEQQGQVPPGQEQQGQQQQGQEQQGQEQQGQEQQGQMQQGQEPQ